MCLDYGILKPTHNRFSFVGGGYMPTGIEVTKQALDDFKKIQEYMLLAKKENATETYAKLKDEYLTIKALLQVSGVNLSEIDKIKE